MAACSSCGAEILWLRTRAGNRMPIDMNDKVRSIPEGSVVFEDARDALPKGIVISHFATCPDAAKHRKSK